MIGSLPSTSSCTSGRLRSMSRRKSFGMTDMLVSDSKKGHALAEALGDKSTVLMRGHGVAVVGSTIPIAVGRSIYLDINAKVEAQALASRILIRRKLRK